ncbi:MAG: ABC transporter substrate-binding protein [Planctomycetota bacterium]
MFHHLIRRLPTDSCAAVAVPCVSALLAIGVLSIPGCGDAGVPSAAAAAETRGENAVTPRIAALVPFAADQLIAIGVRPVAVPQLAGEVPSAWRGLPTITVDHSAGPNIEQLIAAEPDYVITSSTYAQFVEGIKQVTGARIVVMDVQSVEDIATHVESLGELTAETAAAAARADEIRQYMNAAYSGDQTVDVLAVFGTPHAFFAFLPDSYLGDRIEHSGGRLITDGMTEHSVFRGLAPLSMEVVIDRDPDQLLVLFHGPAESAQAMLDRDPLWSELSAVKSGSVVFLQDDLYAMRPGSELGRAMADIRAVVDSARERQP